MQPKETDMRYLLIVFLLTSCASDFDYPNAKKEQSNYSLHGSTVIDPYKYMEDFESSYVVAWSDQQNSLVESYLADSEINNIQKIYATNLIYYFYSIYSMTCE